LLIYDAEISKPRYVRVNTLKMDVDSALLELGQQNMVLSAIFTFVDYDIQYVLHLSTNVTYLKLKKQHRIQSTPKFFDSNRDGLTCSTITMFLMQ